MLKKVFFVLFCFPFCSYLFSWIVGRLAGPRVVGGPVKGHRPSAAAVPIEHLIALGNLDAVHLNRAARLAGHQDLR